MNKTQIEACLRIFAKLKSRPISKLFLGTPEFPCEAPMEHPATFRSIETKLQRDLYSNIQQFKIEVQQTLSSFMKQSEKDPLRAAAAEQLLNEFQDEYDKFELDALPVSLRLNLLSCEFEDYLFKNKNMSVREQEEENKNPGAKLFETDAESISIKQLTREIKFLHSPDLLLRVASYIFKQQPEVIQMEGELVVNFEMMNEETLKGTKVLVRSILRDVALGKIDPYKNSLENMKPVSLQN